MKIEAFLIFALLTLRSPLAAQGTPATGGVIPLGETALFDELPVVEAAALHAQTLQEAPANVTVISASDIRKFGYRTLGEALSSVRGFYVTYDRMYHYVGVRGFSLPGDFNTRFLVMLNGHPMTENVFGSNNFFGQDFGLDMELVHRIEVVRGPSSALYGSNAIFATINIVTKSPIDQPRVSVTTDVGSFGEKRVAVSTAAYLGHGANLLLSASVFNNEGQSHYIPEFDRPETNNGVAKGLDGERGYHTFANLRWREWDFVAYVNSREKEPPVNWETSALFNHSGTRLQDRRNFFSLSRTAGAGAGGKLRMRVSYEQYRYDDRFYYPLDNDIQDVREFVRGDWITANIVYSVPLSKRGRLTAGGEWNFDIRNLQRTYAVYPQFEERYNINRPDRSFALFLQQEWRLSDRWSAVFGVRLDETRNFGQHISPRLAAVYQQSKKTVYKFVYGHSFRNPTAYEQYYTDGFSYLPNGALRKEQGHTFESSVERRLRPELTAIATAYHYQIRDIIQAAFLPGDQQQFQNLTNARANGVEFELSGKTVARVEASASVALQNTTGKNGARLANSPRVIIKSRLAVPLLKERLQISGGAQHSSSRLTRTGQPVQPVTLLDATATWRYVRRANWQVQFGVRNLLNCIYDDPVAIAVDKLRQDGRSVFLRLTWEFGE